MSDEQTPIQAAVEEPILNSPFYEPAQHWIYNREGHAIKSHGRRPAQYHYLTQRTGSAQGALEGIGSDEGADDLPLINRLREDVKRWRNSGYENATQVTKQLLRHWGRKDRTRRLFFCQVEAVETVIYLTEILESGRKPRFKPRVSIEDFQNLCQGKQPHFVTEDRIDPNVREDHFPTLIDSPWDKSLQPLRRYGCKMATGSGKTLVMAMLITWAFCNRGRVAGDTRFANSVLVACPNLTVKERLQVLRPERPDNYYDAFDIVPSALRPLMNQGRVLVENWHQFAPESPHVEGGSSYRIVDKGEESPEAFCKRVLGDLAERGPIMVLNDEAHHAYRPAPPDQRKTKFKSKTDEDLEFGQADKDDIAEATVWVGGLDKINQSAGIQFCVDLSATPFYLAGTGYIEGAPFPWLVSDFGLTDAIESGITKIPRLPISDTTGKPDPKFFKLWEEIRNAASASDMIRGKPKPQFVLQQAEAALTTLAAQWKARFDQHQEATTEQAFVPPAMIVVCDNTDIAQLFYEYISGETQIEIEEKGKTKKTTSYGKSGLFEELKNAEDQTYTLRIDTKLLADAEAGAGQTKSQHAEQLREIVATVGTRGAPGEKIRCVVSVQMLTEGWDANNVTQILGLRAFGSQLLCEQVVGRGLRRMNYDFDPETEKLAPEYVDVFGIPFSVIPYKGRKSTTPVPEDKPKNHVKALPDRKDMAMRFPIVEGYVLDLKKNFITADIDSITPVTIMPIENPTEVFVQPQVGIKEGHLTSQSFETERLDRRRYYEANHIQTIKFEIARQIVYRLTETSQQGNPKLQRTSRHQLFPQVYKLVDEFIETRVNWNGIDQRELGLEVYAKQVVERLCDAIRPDEAQGEPPLLPILNRFRPFGSTFDVNFITTRKTYPTHKSHIDQVVLDTKQWEQSAAFYLEASADVAFYARNDHMDLSIPYDFLGTSHHFFPDFLVRLVNGVTLVLEIKGRITSQEEAKFEAAQRWVTAVNNWGKLGHWEFVLCDDPQMLPGLLPNFQSSQMVA